MRKRKLLATVWALLLVVAACGGDSAEDVTTTSGGTETTADGGVSTTSGGGSGVPTHDEIVAAAEQEPSGFIALATAGDLVGEDLAAMFNEKYPFAEAQVFDSGSGDAQTVQLELAAGRHESDVVRLFEPQWTEYTDFLLDLDLAELAEAGSLAIPVEMIEPEFGRAAYSAVFLGATTFNPERVAEYGIDMTTVATWDDLLAACDEMGGGQVTEDLGPEQFATLGVAMGTDGLVEYAEAFQERCDPVFLDGNTARNTAVGAGEYAISATGNHHSAIEVQGEGGNLEIAFLDPIPGKAASMTGINATTERPNMSLLYMEFLFSPEVQALFDEKIPSGSLIIEENAGHRNYEIVDGRETSIESWESLSSTPERVQLLQETWGFPSG